MSLRSGAGLDGLQNRCQTILHGELDWSPKTHEQLTGRLDRPGQKSQVMSIYLVCDEGSDPVMVEILGLKNSQSSGIVDPLKGIEENYSDQSPLMALAKNILNNHKEVL